MIQNIVHKIIFRIKNIKKIIKPYSLVGAKDIIIGKNTLIKSFASLEAHKNKSKGKIFIGDNIIIKECSKLLAGAGIIRIGDNVGIGSKLTILGGGNVNIGNNVLISYNVVISSSSHNFSDLNTLVVDTPSIFNEINIKNNIFIGANSTILMGTTIEEGAIIGAGSVVTENTIIGKNEVWYGNPAKLQKIRPSFKEAIEEEIVKYIKKYPFHNLFILYKINDVFASEFGGTCSDRSFHFKKILDTKFKDTNIEIKLHRAKINNKKTHTIIRIKIDKLIYFCDVGMGFPITRLLPTNEAISFSSYGIYFETKIDKHKIIVYIDEDEGKGLQELMIIDIKEQPRDEIEKYTNNRMQNINNLPLSTKLRYFFIYNGKFYKIKE